MTTQYDPSELDNFLDELEQGKHDQGAEEAPGAAEPQPGESQGEDDFDVDEFTVGGQSAAQPAAPATQTAAPAQPVGNADNVDPFELQRKLAIEQGKYLPRHQQPETRRTKTCRSSKGLYIRSYGDRVVR